MRKKSEGFLSTGWTLLPTKFKKIIRLNLNEEKPNIKAALFFGPKKVTRKMFFVTKM